MGWGGVGWQGVRTRGARKGVEGEGTVHSVNAAEVVPPAASCPGGLCGGCARHQTARQRGSPTHRGIPAAAHAAARLPRSRGSPTAAEAAGGGALLSQTVWCSLVRARKTCNAGSCTEEAAEDEGSRGTGSFSGTPRTYPHLPTPYMNYQTGSSRKL